MYSFELSNLIKDGKIGADEYIKYFNIQNSPQITHIHYDAFSNKISVSTSDKYDFQFEVVRNN